MFNFISIFPAFLSCSNCNLIWSDQYEHSRLQGVEGAYRQHPCKFDLNFQVALQRRVGTSLSFPTTSCPRALFVNFHQSQHTFDKTALLVLMFMEAAKPRVPATETPETFTAFTVLQQFKHRIFVVVVCPVGNEFVCQNTHASQSWFVM